MDKTGDNVQEITTTWGHLKPRLIEILITAVLSAALAFLQSLISQWSGHLPVVSEPEAAAGIGAGLRTLALVIKKPFS